MVAALAGTVIPLLDHKNARLPSIKAATGVGREATLYVAIIYKPSLA